MESKALLIEYYDALSEGEFDKVAECYDLPCKLISLYGALDCASREQVRNAFVSIHDAWKSKCDCLAIRKKQKGRLIP